MKFKTHIALLVSLMALNSAVQAIEPIPAETGWSGFVTLGVSAMDAKSNMVAGVDRYGVDIGKSTIGSLSSEPESDSQGLPQANLNIKYTFASQTQLFIGNSLEDIVQMDTASVAGVRQQFADKSILEFSFVSTPTFAPIQVWADPYVVGTSRVETDRTARGVRLEYDKMFGTGFGIQYTSREVEIESELSGTTQLGLTAAQAQLLNRNGDVTRLVGYYRWPRMGRNEFEVRLGRRVYDLDGKAMSGDENEVQFTYAYLGERFMFGGNVFFWKGEADAVNPVFGVTREDDTTGVALFLFDRGLFSSKHWWGQASAVRVDQDSNIDFYKASSTILSLGAQYRF